MTLLRTVPALWPYCEFNIEQRTYPAIAIEWQKIADANGYATWHCKLIYWDGNEPRVALIPQTRVRKVGGT